MKGLPIRQWRAARKRDDHKGRFYSGQYLKTPLVCAPIRFVWARLIGFIEWVDEGLASDG